MVVSRAQVNRTNLLRVLDRLTYVLAALFTLFTIYYAFYLLTNLSLLGLDFKPYVPDLFQFAEQAQYVVLFTGWGIAVYYLDYARDKLTERFDVSESEADGSDTAADTAVDSGTESDLDAGLDEDIEPSIMNIGGDDGLLPDIPYQDEAHDIYDRFDPYIALLLSVGTVIATAYIFSQFSRLQGDAFILGFSAIDHLVGVLLIVIVTDATRRAFGWIIAAVAVGSIIYMHEAVSAYLPGILSWSGDDFTGLVEEGALGVQSGIYDSTIMGIGSTWVAIFIMFAGMAKAFGLMDFIRAVGTELGGTLRTGVVQIAVISSMVMGSITGSAAANTATTGSFTIPMIQDQGVRDDYAAAIEAVASAGGQMLPPVMGVAAFLMADIIGVPYLDIVQAGTIPAMLFYLSVGIAIHFTILKHGWTSNELSSFDWSVLKGGIHFAPPLFVLLYSLIVLGYNPMTAGLYTILTLLVVMIIKNLYERMRDREVAALSKQTADGLNQGGLEMAPLVGVLAAMGLIVEYLETSGLTGRLGSSITGFADVTILGFTGGLALVLFLAMIASIAFGLGMPTPAAYILVAFLVAGSVTELGVPDITTHMFVFYFAMLSAITPPVAISVAVGSRIADTSFMSACVQALRIGAPGFVIPYAFVANNSLIQWTGGGTIQFLYGTGLAFLVVFAGTVSLIVATIGFDGARDLSYPVRAGYVAIGFVAMFAAVAPGPVVGEVHVAQILAAAIVFLTLLVARYVVGYDIETGDDTPTTE